MVTKTVLGEHTANYVLEQTLIAFVTLSNISGAERLLTTGITREAKINTICPFVTCHLNLIGIDDNYIVTTISVGCETRFVLTSQNLGNL